MPKKIILVRHGETQYNVERKLQGWLDIPLNKTGVSQAKAVAERLRKEQVSAIYSSDHKRALMTAQAIATHHNLIPITKAELREDYMGIFEGWQWEVEKDPDREKMWQERTEARIRGDVHFTIGDSETLYSHLTRVQKVFEQIKHKHQDQTVIVVSHGGTINRIMEHFKFKQIGGSYTSYKNTSVTVMLKTEIGYQLELDNDISHLR